MNQYEIKEATESLAAKKVNQPCPRCSSNDFSIVGESEIIVVRTNTQSRYQNALAGLSYLPLKTSMPVIIITCDNCGYVVQHAKASLVTTNKLAAARGINLADVVRK